MARQRKRGGGLDEDELIPLRLELVPQSCCSGLREQLPPRDWVRLRDELLVATRHCCQACGVSNGPERPVNCQEVWDYDDVPHIQRLERMVVLCLRCRRIRYLSRNSLDNPPLDEGPLAHLAEVNGWDEDTTYRHLQEALALYDERDRYSWRTDLTALTTYGIRVPDGRRPPSLAGGPRKLPLQPPPQEPSWPVAFGRRLASLLSPLWLVDYLLRWR